jgi:hypothetical protein
MSFHEGDDGIVGGKGDISVGQAFAKHMVSVALSLGLVLTIDVRTSVEDVKFCGRYITVNPDGTWSTFCAPMRTLIKFHITTSGLSRTNPGYGEYLKGLLKAKAESYYYTDANTPIIGVLCYKLRQLLADVKAIHDKDTAYRMKDNIGALAMIPPDTCDSLRIDFGRLSGITIPEQIIFEEYVRGWTYIPNTLTHHQIVVSRFGLGEVEEIDPTKFEVLPGDCLLHW